MVEKAASSAPARPSGSTQRNPDEEVVIEETDNWKLVEMNEKHIDKVMKIQTLCYEPCYRDTRQSYVDRARLFPEGNAVMFVPEEPTSSSSPTAPGSSKRRKKKAASPFKMCGYILAQPFDRGVINDVSDVTELAKWLEAKKKSGNHTPSDDECIYIHEISIHPDFRGQGLTRPLVEFTEKLARQHGYRWMSLVALETALPFWKRTGYTLVRKVDYEGHTCYYMEKCIDS